MLDVSKLCRLMDAWLSLVALSTSRDEPKFARLRSALNRLRSTQQQWKQEESLDEIRSIIGKGMGSLYDVVPTLRRDVTRGLTGADLYKTYLDDLNLLTAELDRLLQQNQTTTAKKGNLITYYVHQLRRSIHVQKLQSPQLTYKIAKAMAAGIAYIVATCILFLYPTSIIYERLTHQQAFDLLDISLSLLGVLGGMLILLTAGARSWYEGYLYWRQQTNDSKVTLRDIQPDDVKLMHVQMGAPFTRFWSGVQEHEPIAKKLILCDARMVGSVVCYENDGHFWLKWWLEDSILRRDEETTAKVVVAFVADISTRPICARVAKYDYVSLYALESAGFLIWVGDDWGFGDDVEEVMLKVG